MLKTAYEYSLKWRFKFNLEKCAVVIFDNDGEALPIGYGACDSECVCGHHFRFGTWWIKEAVAINIWDSNRFICSFFFQFHMIINQ